MPKHRKQTSRKVKVRSEGILYSTKYFCTASLTLMFHQKMFWFFFPLLSRGDSTVCVLVEGVPTSSVTV